MDTEVGNRAGLGADVGELIGGLKMALTMSDQQSECYLIPLHDPSFHASLT